MSKELARKFHETYERLAPDFGYETREDTKAFDPTTPNGQLMIAVCREVAGELEAQRDALLEALHEIAVATDGAEAHLMVWVADKAEAAIAKVRGGRE